MEDFIVHSVVVCDDVRKEATGKDILIGVYSYCVIRCILRVACWQHGQRGRVLAIARAIVTRTDVMEFAT